MYIPQTTNPSPFLNFIIKATLSQTAQPKKNGSSAKAIMAGSINKLLNFNDLQLKMHKIGRLSFK